MEIIKNDNFLNKKIRNNSSILRYLKFNGIKILYTGDMEKDGWKWLKENNSDFVNTLKDGVDVLIAPHHGHKSGFPKELFDITGDVELVILSKGSEENIEGTNVSTQYFQKSKGTKFKSLKDGKYYYGKVLATRSNGNIYMAIDNYSLTVFADMASPNNEKYSNQREITQQIGEILSSLSI